MQSRWVDRDAKAAVDRYAAAGISPELALRVYTTRLLGGDPSAGPAWRRQHSVKTAHARPRGRRGRGALHQGHRRRHGHDRARRHGRGAACGAAAAAARSTISPTTTWRACSAPICSIRWRRARRSKLLLHAFMPHKFVDHTHANAVLSLIDQPDGAEALRGGLWRPHRPRALRACRASVSPKPRPTTFDSESQGRRPHPRQARHLHASARARRNPTSA